MRGSLKIFSWFNIPVYIHWSFSLIFIFVIWQNFHAGNGMNVLLPIGILLGLFACVLLHEFGHALMARRFGIHTQDIILTPIGGIARLERMPEKPRQELLVAIAGPMVNVIIAALIFGGAMLLFYNNAIDTWIFKTGSKELLQSIFSISQGQEELDMSDTMQDNGMSISFGMIFFIQLLVVNIMMIIFNLVPAFPMDGGRVLRALLAMKVGRLKATKIAVLIGQGIALLFILTGVIFYDQFITMPLIGFFVFYTARSEYAMVRLEEVLKNYVAGDLMRTQFTQILVNDWMQTPIELLTRGQEQHFLVFGMEQHLIGYLSDKKIIEAAKRKDVSAAVQQYMEQPPAIVSDKDSLRYVYYLLNQNSVSILGVTDSYGAITGVIDKNGLEGFMKIKG